MHDNSRIVAINFCGGCKPVIDRLSIALAIENALTARGIAVAFNDWNAEFIVRLSGCSVGCASRYHASDRPGAVIAGSTFDHTAVDETELAGMAIDVFNASLSMSHEAPGTRHARADAPACATFLRRGGYEESR